MATYPDLTENIVLRTDTFDSWKNKTNVLNNHSSFVESKLGDPDVLDTTEKTFVASINEVHGETDVNAANIGTMSNLSSTYTASGNLVSAMNDLQVYSTNYTNTEVSSEAATRQSEDNTLQSAIDLVELSSGLTPSGGYVQQTLKRYISTALSLAEADNKLDDALDATQQELDVTQTSIGTEADGTMSLTGNYISGSVKTSLSALDSRAFTNQNDITSLNTQTSLIQTELDNTQVGAGLSNTGAYIGTISGATSLSNADTLLQNQISSNDSELSTHDNRLLDLENTIQDLGVVSGQRIDLDGNYVNNLDVSSAIEALDQKVKSNDTSINSLTSSLNSLSIELNDTQLGSGLNTNGSYTAPNGSFYITNASSLKDADSLLDAQMKVNANDIASSGTDIVDVDTTLQSFLGTGKGGLHNYTGTNYINGRNVRDASVQLDSKLKSVADDIITIQSQPGYGFDPAGDLHAVATSGKYSDLTGTPTPITVHPISGMTLSASNELSISKLRKAQLPDGTLTEYRSGSAVPLTGNQQSGFSVERAGVGGYSYFYDTHPSKYIKSVHYYNNVLELTNQDGGVHTFAPSFTNTDTTYTAGSGIDISPTNVISTNFTNTNTWHVNTSTREGYVPTPTGANRVYSTDNGGTPAWRSPDDSTWNGYRIEVLASEAAYNASAKNANTIYFIKE